MKSKSATTLMRSVQVGMVALVLTAGSGGAYWGVIQYQGNFHAVKEGEFYRSAQLAKDELQGVIRDHGIRSILNLRGGHPGQAWYDDEVTVSRALGVAHYDYALSAYRVVTVRQVDEILDIIRNAPKPLLVHCKSGADRAGLISALYRFKYEAASAEQADGQLSLLYGHFPYLGSRSKAMDESFWAFVGIQGSPTAGQNRHLTN